MQRTDEPIACTLSDADTARQARDWADLRSHALSTERLDHGLAMTFAEEMADALDDLAARESECCSFLSLRTTRTDAGIRIEITSDNPDALPIVETFQGLIAEVDIR